MNLKVCPDQEIKVLGFGLKEKNQLEKLKNLNVKDKMPREKSKKLNVMNCKCEKTKSSESNIGEIFVLKNCKCRPSGRKERSYDSLIIEKI